MSESEVVYLCLGFCLGGGLVGLFAVMDMKI